MKYFLSILLFLSVLFFSSKSKAEELRGDFWYQLAIQPVYAFTQLNVHEGSHVLAAVLSGNRVDYYKPYPHYMEVDGKKYFFWGSTNFSSHNGESLILFAPTLSNLNLFITFDIFLENFNHDNFMSGSLYSMMIWNWIDFTYHTNLRSGGSDITRWCERTNIDRTGFQIVGNMVSVIGLWRLISRGTDILFPKEHKIEQDTFTYFISPSYTGIGGKF